MIIDSHAHYDDEAFEEDRDNLLKSMPDNGIEKIINVGANIKRQSGFYSIVRAVSFYLCGSWCTSE